MSSRSNTARGFTLIELLVAISVLAIIAVLGWRGLDGIVRARIALTAEMEQTRSLQLTFAQLQSDCSYMLEANELRERAVLMIEPDRLVLVRRVFIPEQASALQIVAYRLNNGVLTRTESTPTRNVKEINNLWNGVVAGIDASPGVVLQTGVAAMKIRAGFVIIPVNANEAAPQSIDWREDNLVVVANAETAFSSSKVPQELANPMPKGLEVTLQLRGHGNNTPVMTKILFVGKK